MKVLSLFNGISCGRVALERAGIPVERYVSYEIDKYANVVSKSNYPYDEYNGDVTTADFTQYRDFDLLIGGSPCQGFSSSGKGLNFDDPRSKLFFEFVRALREVQPKYFLFENVGMTTDCINIISAYLGVEPIHINSRLVSAQDRKRLYWTNIPNVEPPEDKGISVHSIIGGNQYAAAMRGRRINENGHRSDYDRTIKISQYIECRKDEKTNCLTTVEKDNVVVGSRQNRKSLSDSDYRYYTVAEYEQLQTLPIDYTSCISANQAKKAIGNGWTVDVIAHIFSYLR